jgi:hypothetical protein
MNKKMVISTEAELRSVARKHLAEDPVLSWNWMNVETGTGKSRIDGALELFTSGRRKTFDVEFKLRPTARDLEVLAGQPHRRPWMLIAPELSESLIAVCRERGINAIDLNGRTWVLSEGLVIDRSPTPKRRYSTSWPTLNPFSMKSSRLARALLSNESRNWSLTELVNHTALSGGLVSRLLRALEQEGWIERSSRRIILRRPKELLDAWAIRDDWAKRTAVREYSALTKDLEELAQRTKEGLTAGENRPVFTQWFAANLRHPYTIAPVVSAYVRDFPSEEVESALALRPVTDGGRIWLIVPRDMGVFLETRNVAGFTLACDTQIYLDLQAAGLRGPDQAQALREWPEFNKGSR